MGFCTGRWTGISWTICIQSAPRSRWITTPTHHSIFTGPMLLLATFCGLSACTPAGHIAGLYFPHGSSAPHTGCCTFLKLSWQHVRRSIYRRQSFQVWSLGPSSRGQCCYLWRVPEFSFSIMWDGWKEAHMPKNQLDSFSRFDRTPTCDRHRQTLWNYQLHNHTNHNLRPKNDY